MAKAFLNENETLDTVFKFATGMMNAVSPRRTSGGVPKYSYSSLAKAASSLIAVFPVLVSRTISAKSAQKISKFIEQKACHLFILALQQANISDAKSGVEYLRNFHQNLDVGSSGVDEVIKTMQTWIDAYGSGFSESVASYMRHDAAPVNYEAIFEADDIEISAQDINKILKLMHENENIQVYDTQLNSRSINDFMIKESGSEKYKIDVKPYTESDSFNLNEYMVLNEADPVLDKWRDADATLKYAMAAAKKAEIKRKDKESRSKRILDIQMAKAKKKALKDRNEILKQAHDKLIQNDKDTKKEKNEILRKSEEEKLQRQRNRDLLKDTEDLLGTGVQIYKDIKKERDEKWEKQKQEKIDLANKHAKFSSGNTVSVFKDQDIKKMNDAVPSLLVVRFYQSTTATVATEFIIGVKSKMIPITTTEVLRRIMNDNKDGKKFLNFMRAVTGELKASEFLLGISRIKDDVLSYQTKGAYGKIWNLLKNRADAAREQVKYKRQNDFSAITTVLISQADADELFREENFDISSPGNALHFMDSYNLMAFGIVDDALEVFKIMFDDGSKSFEEISYTMLERETKEGETYKKLINLIATSK